MPTTDEYRSRIRQYHRAALMELWNSIASRATSDWEPGKALEYLALRMFELDGAEVVWPYSVTMFEHEVEQIDGAVYASGLSFLLESKDSAMPVSFEPIAKLRTQLARRPSGVVGLLVSASGFTEPAKLLADFTAPQAILLWDGDDIGRSLETGQSVSTLVKKYRAFVELGVAFNRKEEIP